MPAFVSLILRRMKRNLPLTLLALGIFLLVAGFGYDLRFAGIPYPDPTPELAARYAFHARIASGFYIVGLGAVLGGIAAGVVRLVTRRARAMPSN
jgi:hypothetical protein